MTTTPTTPAGPVAFRDLLRDPRTRKPVLEVIAGAVLFVVSALTLPDMATWFVHATPDQRLAFLLAVGMAAVWSLLLVIALRALLAIGRHIRR